jgi:hypothetical protein
MEPTRRLARDLLLDKVEQARQMTPEEKLLAGGELFDFAVFAVRAGVLMRDPNATPDQVASEVRRRLDLAERIDSR